MWGLVRTHYLALCLVSMALLTGCPPDEDEEATQTPGEVTPTATPITPSIAIQDWLDAPDIPGSVRFNFALIGDPEVAYDISCAWSPGGMTFKPATLAPNAVTSGLVGSAEGTIYSVVWDTVADLQYANSTVYFQISAKGDGIDLPPTTVQLTVDNRSYDRPCVIDVEEPPWQDGQIPFTYRLLDTGGDICTVTVEVEYQGRRITATSKVTDPSSLVDVEVPSEGLQQQFVWDSETDVGPYDMSVALIFTATDTNNVDEDRIPFTVENDPTPRVGDVIFTEVYPWPENSTYTYLELLNVSHHTLNLKGVSLSSLKSNVVVSPDVDLLHAPGQYLVMGLGNDIEYQVDWVYAGFTMNRGTDTLTFWYGDPEKKTIVDQIQYNRANYSETTGSALGLLPDILDAAGNDAVAAWCVEQGALPGFPDEHGSPGLPSTCTAAL